MNWHSVSNFLNAFALFAGVGLGVINGNPPISLPDWRFLAAFMIFGLLIFPFIIYAVMRLHVLIRSGVQLVEPRRDRCFISATQPLDTLLFAAHLSFWQGLGVLVTFWIAWPHNLLLGGAMILGYYSILSGIRLSLTLADLGSQRDITM